MSSEDQIYLLIAVLNTHSLLLCLLISLNQGRDAEGTFLRCSVEQLEINLSGFGR